ncbi:unnamed protein product [Arabidopsis halleri]
MLLHPEVWGSNPRYCDLLINLQIIRGKCAGDLQRCTIISVRQDSTQREKCPSRA